MMEQQKIREEKALVLDFLPNGYPFDKSPSHKKSAIIQALGIDRYTLLELVPKKDVHLGLHDEVYIGEGKRDKVHHINGRIPIRKLTHTARGELDFELKELILKQEQKFVDFFNKARPLSMRMHQLELLPGLGKKHMWEIIEERKAEPFKSFDDIRQRVKLMPDIHKLIFMRIMKEIDGDEKHRLFTDAPPKTT
jgi:putative nucleotide binding protein